VAEQYFYAPNPAGGTYTFDPFESRHIAKVLRKGPGDTVELTDGKGHVYQARILSADKKGVRVALTDRRFVPPPRRQLDVWMAPPKSTDRFEWFLEKAVELGVRRIVPLRTRRTQRLVWKPERWEKIIISALKQSKRAYKPVLEAPRKLEDLLPADENVFAALCSAERYFNADYIRVKEAAVIIGPEGGFAPEELALMEEAGVKPVKLSSARLRTETAGLAAVCLFHVSDLNSEP